MAIKRFLFDYEAIDKNKNRQKGEISASSITRARGILTNQGLVVLKIRKKSIPLFNWRNRISAADITVFTRQMATMITAGIPIMQSLTVIAEGVPNTGLADLIKKIKNSVESGINFSQALKLHPKYFDELYCNLIESGEQSGTLDTMLSRIALYKEKSESLKRKIKKALYYPIAVLTVAVIVTIILLVKVVPTFKELFKSFGGELPTFTQFILTISELLQNYGLYILGVVIILIFYFIQSYRTKPSFRHALERLYIKLPLIGQLLRKAIVARFARTLATTSSAGVPITDAMDSVGKAAGNIVYQNAIFTMREGLATGQPLHVVMRQTGIFPLLVSQMVSIGEESGTLDQMLEKVANIYEEEVDLSVDGLTTLLEPLIMILLGIIVGSLVIAMYLPIFKMGSIV